MLRIKCSRYKVTNKKIEEREINHDKYVHKYLIIASLRNILKRQASNLKYDCVAENVYTYNIIPT